MATYLNPMSVFPEMEGKVHGATAGGLAYDREQDYKKLMQNELFMKELARQKEMIDFQNLQADQGNVALERQGKTATLQGKLPYLGELASTGAQAEIGSNTFKRDVTQGPEARNAGISGFLKQLDDDQVIKLGRSVDITKKLLPQANAMGPEQGSAWMRQQIEQYKKMGIDIDDFLANPATWKQWMEGMTNFDPEFQRRMSETRFKEGEHNKRNTENRQSQERIAEQNRRATLEAARVRGAGSGKMPKNPIEAAERAAAEFTAYDQDPDTDKNSAEYKQYLDFARNQIETAFDSGPSGQRVRKTIDEGLDTFKLPKDQRDELYAATRREYALRKLNKSNYKPTPGQPAPQPNQGQAKPDPLGLR